MHAPAGYAFAKWIFIIIILMFGYSFLTSGWKCLTYSADARRAVRLNSFVILVLFPIGTVFGVYSLWVLSHERTKQLLSEME